MKFLIYISLLLCITSQNICAQVSIIETKIARSYHWSDEDLKDYEELDSLIKKHPYISGTLHDLDQVEAKDIPETAINSFRHLVQKFGDEYEYAIWSTDPMGCSWYCGAFHFQTVSSSLPNTSKNIYDANSIFDWDIRTAWVEGAKGYGIGEYLEVHFPMSFAQATRCYIVNGYNKNEKTWRNNSRVKTMNLYVDDKFVATLNLKDIRDEQSFELPDTIPNLSDTTRFKERIFHDTKYKVSTLKFLITDVYKGDKYDDTAISEISFDGIGVH